MAKYYIRVSNKNHQYTGKSSELTDEQKEGIESLLTTVAKGEAKHFQIETEGGDIHFFPKKYLKKSVVTLVKDS